MENPFKYGAIVDADYFTDRVDEVKYISQFIQSEYTQLNGYVT